MPIDPDSLSSLASEYAKDMTSIRGRRVRRLLKREFAGADHVVPAQLSNGMPALLGLSENGAALCATDGTGPNVSIVKWVHGSDTAFETQFDLLKDSLPILHSTTVPMASLGSRMGLRASTTIAEDRVRSLLGKVLEVAG